MKTLQVETTHPEEELPSYHDLYITTKTIKRTSIFDLPFSLMVTCTRTGGWELWNVLNGIQNATLIAGEYDQKWLVLDVNGSIVVDGRVEEEEEVEGEESPEAKHTLL